MEQVDEIEQVPSTGEPALRRATNSYIDVYNNQPLRSAFGFQTSVEFEG